MVWAGSNAGTGRARADWKPGKASPGGEFGVSPRKMSNQTCLQEEPVILGERRL